MVDTLARPSTDMVSNYTDAVKTLAHHDHVIINDDGKNEFVLITMDMFEKFKEFLHRQYMYNELQKSKALLDDPNARFYEEDEVFAEVEKIFEAKGL